MIARITCLALCACAYARVQPQAQIYVDVSGEPDDVEKRYTPELIEDFRATKADALLLYTEYTGQTGTELKYFLRNISSFANDTKKILDRRLYDSAFDPYDATTPEDTASLLQMYANHVNSSLELDKSDRRIMKGWATDFQVQQINVTTHYRLQMMRHKEHSYSWINGSAKWHECIQIHRKDIQHSEQNYYAAESHCLKATNANEGKKRHAVYQVEKEIKKWRKSYRYLLNKCKSNNPGDDIGTGECLVDYVKRDNYHVTFQRLILLKLEAMSDLFKEMRDSLLKLEECLKSTLSHYLDRVRGITSNLNQCYSIKNKDSWLRPYRPNFT